MNFAPEGPEHELTIGGMLVWAGTRQSHISTPGPLAPKSCGVVVGGGSEELEEVGYWE